MFTAGMQRSGGERERAAKRERETHGHTDTTAAAELWTSGIGPWPPVLLRSRPRSSVRTLAGLRGTERKVPPALPAAAAATVNRESPAGRQKCILSTVVGTHWSRGRWSIRSSFFKGRRALRVTFCTCASSKGGLTKINLFSIFRIYL